MSKPLPFDIANELATIKKTHNWTYATLGKKIGLSGTTLSSRIAHCDGNKAGLDTTKISSYGLQLIQNFLDKQKKVDIDLTNVETFKLISEIKRRSPSCSITF